MQVVIQQISAEVMINNYKYIKSMKQYYKNINNSRVYYKDPLIVDGMQVFNPSEEMILADGWTAYTPPSTPAPTPEQLLQEAKDNKITQIESYDDSTEVNECYIVYQGNTLSYWGGKSERASLQKAVEDYISQEIPTYRLDLREYGISVSIPCHTMLDMLQKLEVYATQCYNVTSDHIYAIQALATAADIESYDYTLNYPRKLTFNL